MHLAQKYIDGHVLPSTPSRATVTTTALAGAQADALRQALHSDAVSYFYSGTVSIGDAIQALDRSLYSWATVKLYYAAFYLARAMLAAQGTVIFYMGSKPYSWNCTSGASPVRRDGQTHKVVLSEFVAAFPKNALSTQAVGMVNAFDWLMKRRESVNYGAAKFSEPTCPDHFEAVARNGVRRSLAAYIRDRTYLYAFDADHAMLAMPIEALKQFLSMANPPDAVITVPPEDRHYVSSLFVDKLGPLPEMAALFR